MEIDCKVYEISITCQNFVKLFKVAKKMNYNVDWVLYSLS